MKFLSVTHTAHKIQDIAFHDTEKQGLKYLADYIYANLDPEDKALAKETEDPMNVSMDIEGNGTKNVFCWQTSLLTDEHPKEGITLRWKNDKGVDRGVVSFLVEIPEKAKFLVFPIGFSENFNLVTISNDPYQNFDFYDDFITAQNNANQMYAGINRKMKKDHTNDSVTGTFYEEYTTREISFDGLQQYYTRVEIIDLNAAISDDVDDATATAATPVPAPNATSTPTQTTVAPKTKTKSKAKAKKLVPPSPKPVVPLTNGQKITTDYLKNWIENVIVNSKVFSGNYAVTIVRDYKNSAIKNYFTGHTVVFKGLVDAKKYPKNIEYRGFTVKIDVGNNTVYEGKVHIISSDTLIAGVGIEATNDLTANAVFDNIFTNASTNDPKAAGISKGSFEKMPITTCVFIQTVDKTKKRVVTTTILPSEVEKLKEFINGTVDELPERVEFAINEKYGMEWSQVADVVGALLITMDAKIETVGLVDLPTDSTTNVQNQTQSVSTPQTNPNTNSTANATQTQSTVNTGTVNATIEILDIHNPVKNVIGHVNMTLTSQDLQDLEDAYTSSRIDQETVMDRLFNTNIQNAIDKQFPNVDWDLGDTTITYPNNSTKKIVNPWM